MAPLLVITGFMGTGKTSVGRKVAFMLGREFVDMDSEIVKREGKSIRDIFETDGEAYFRKLESSLCEELASRRDCVIATGGGALLNPRNRGRFADAFVICLDATVDELLSRLKGDDKRPLLQARSREDIRGLQSARAAAYGAIQYHLDTTGKKIEEIAGRIIAEYETWWATEGKAK